MAATTIGSLKELIDELAEKDIGIDDALTAAELRVKQLRTLKATLDVEAKPKPRTRKKETASA